MKVISLSPPIQDILLKSEAKEKFLLLNAENNQILWAVKVQGKEKEFWDLMQMTIPYGVTIKGLAVNNESETMVNGLYLVNKRNELERRELIEKCFLILSFRCERESRKVMVNEESIEIDLNCFMSNRTQVCLRDCQLVFNEDCWEGIRRKYSRVYSNVWRNVDSNEDEDDGEGEDEENDEKEEIDEEMEVMIEQLGLTIRKNDWNVNWNQMQKKFSNFLNENNDQSLELQLLFPSLPQSLSLSENNDRQFNISINALIPKTSNLKDFLEQYKSHSTWLINKISSINHTHHHLTISLYSIHINTLLPFTLLYSIPQELKSYTSSLNTQSLYYQSIFSLPTTHPISYSYLHNNLLPPPPNTIKSLHQYLPNHSSSSSIIQGDYLTFICRIEDKSFGCGYRALQTAMSWFFLNNINDCPSYTIPSLQDIKQALVALEEITPNDIDKPYDISITQLGEVLAFLIDCKCEGTSLYHNQLSIFKEALSLSFTKNTSDSSIIILSKGKNSIYTIIGYDNDSEKMLLITHEYIGKVSLINMLKMNTIQWIDIEEFLDDTKKFEYIKIDLK